LAWITPLLYAILILWYFSRWEVTPDVQLSLFQAFFEGWTILVIPVGISILSGFMVHQEELAGNFQGFLGSRMPRSHLFFGKLAILLFLITAGTLTATSALILGFMLLKDVLIAWPIFMIATLLALIGALPLLAIHYWISYAWGFGPSIGIGGVGLLIAALMATHIGDTIWPYVPWAWPVRLPLLTGAYLTYLPGMDSPPDVIASGKIMHLTLQGLIPATITSLVMLGGGATWFARWEGRKKTD
jgi:ABC-2 type transport system permease protein